MRVGGPEQKRLRGILKKIEVFWRDLEVSRGDLHTMCNGRGHLEVFGSDLDVQEVAGGNLEGSGGGLERSAGFWREIWSGLKGS